MKQGIVVIVIAFLLSGCFGNWFTKYGNVNRAIKNETDYVGLSSPELRIALGAPTDRSVGWSDEKGLIQILLFATTRGTITVAQKDNIVIDVDYENRFKK
ncbi:hypothetical protein ACFL3D_06065 [Candidatus Omnitrophota bacterium]